MATGKANRSLAWGQVILLLGIGGIYPAIKAFIAGVPLFGALSLAFAITLIIVGWRLFQRGRAQEPGSTIRTYDHREKRTPDTGSPQSRRDD